MAIGKVKFPTLKNLGQKTGTVPVTIRTNPFPKLKGFNGSKGLQPPLTR